MAENLITATMPITLDGQPYRLRYRAFAFIRYAEEISGGDLISDLMAAGEELAKIGQNLVKVGDAPAAAAAPFAGSATVFKKIRDVLWAGLIDLQPDITRDQVARLFSLDDLVLIAQQITAALNKGMPTIPKSAGAAPRPTPPADSQNLLLNGGADSGPLSETVAG